MVQSLAMNISHEQFNMSHKLRKYVARKDCKLGIPSPILVSSLHPDMQDSVTS